VGSLRGRLRRLEEAADEDTMLLILSDTGEEVRVPFDAPVVWAVWEWRRGMGEDPGPDPLAERMAELVGRGAYEKDPNQDGRILGGRHEHTG
jgi:hypothetical protein